MSEVINHVKELTFVKTKSINCESCGAGLVLVLSQNKTCDCRYCGNTNLILDDGKTKVIQKEVPKPPPIIGTGNKKMDTKTIILTSIAVVVGGLAVYYIYKKMTAKKEEDKRKRILLFAK